MARALDRQHVTPDPPRLRHLIFRDWLRAHPDDRDRYAARKYQAAADNPMSMAGYVAAKASLIVEILRRAGLR